MEAISQKWGTLLGRCFLLDGFLSRLTMTEKKETGGEMVGSPNETSNCRDYPSGLLPLVLIF